MSLFLRGLVDTEPAILATRPQNRLVLEVLSMDLLSLGTQGVYRLNLLYEGYLRAAMSSVLERTALAIQSGIQ